jgi:tRNA(Ile)-lysidine synthase
VSAAEPGAEPFSDGELDSLFYDLERCSRVVLAVSGGPDSTALMLLAHRWRKGRRAGPALIAVTVDHRLRPDSKREAVNVGKLAKTLGIEHHILAWTGKKPSKGLQEAARDARYGLLFGLAEKIGAEAVVTAHTLDDQGETFLMRLARGSGLTGLGGIRRVTARNGSVLLRPLLGVPKSRLVAMLRRTKVPFAKDSSNTDVRFLRSRLRKLSADLASEGLVPERFALAAHRLARADDAIESIVDELQPGIAGGVWPKTSPLEFSASAFFRVPDEIAIRVLGRAVNQTGDEGPAELGKLEALFAAMKSARETGETLRRTLAGALVDLDQGTVRVARAPERAKKKGRGRSQ